MLQSRVRPELLVGFALVLAACSGEDGSNGANGAPGAPGPTGPPGPPGSALGADGGLTAGCLSPCHGFNGIVEEWKTSTHYAAFVANLGGEEVASWTGHTACGNCHAIDAIQYRVEGNVLHGTSKSGPTNVRRGETNYLDDSTHAVTESTYPGFATVAVVHCTTCHAVTQANDPHVTGAPYTPGSFPLRVASGAGDEAVLEKSSTPGVADGTDAGKYKEGNACIYCHKSRKDVTNYIGASNALTSTRWGPHEGPQSDVYAGKGGYHYAGRTYRSSTHQGFAQGCILCHMPPVATNQNVGNHSFYAELSACQQNGCHANVTSFDVGGGQSAMKAGIQELRVALNNRGWLTRGAVSPYSPMTSTDLADQQVEQDLVLPGATGLSADEAGALYNYLLLARGSAGGVHNPIYVRELIYDSVLAVTGSPPATIPIRP